MFLKTCNDNKWPGNWSLTGSLPSSPIAHGKNSLTRSAPLPNDSQARSGARFHTSYDKRYIIKTITSEDVAEMHNILKKYHQVMFLYFYLKLGGDQYS